jgi:hypothetical protein
MPRHYSVTHHEEIRTLAGLSPHRDASTEYSKYPDEWTVWIRNGVLEGELFVNVPNSLHLGDPTVTAISYGTAVERIEDFATRDTPCSGVIHIPPNVKYVGQHAFSGADVTGGFSGGAIGDIYIPDGVEGISGQTMRSQPGLGTGNDVGLFIPDSVQSIGNGTFAANPNLDGPLRLPENVLYTTIQNDLFNGAVKLFGYPNPNELYIPDNVTTIATRPFFGFGTSGTHAITSVRWSKNINTIGLRAFQNASTLTGTFVSPPSLATIGQFAFQACNFTKVVLGVQTTNNFSFIDQRAFRLNANLSEIYLNIPATVSMFSTLATALTFGNIDPNAQIFVTSPYLAGYDATWISRHLNQHTTQGGNQTISEWTTFPNYGA